ncbi:kinase-like domain-containing protein [Lactarius psammicola]|nr:kinase-like domain-containing protein [Lactarius psammicola]
MSHSDELQEAHINKEQPSVVCIRGRYRVGKLLGSGTSEDVYLGRDIKTGQDVALKLEPIEMRSPRLSHEYTIYKALSNVSGVPTIHWYGREVPYNVMVLDRLGLTLEEAISKRHDINLVFLYATQMLSCLESLHKRSYIHRDVKPTNFMTGFDKLSNQVFLIDFGLAQHFRDPSTCQHAPLVSGLNIVGTITFTSINSHLGQTQSRRDDLESLGIIKGRSIEQYGASVLEKKLASTKTLCQGLPAPFVAFTQHIQSLGFDEKPHTRDPEPLEEGQLEEEPFGNDQVWAVVLAQEEQCHAEVMQQWAEYHGMSPSTDSRDEEEVERMLQDMQARMERLSLGPDERHLPGPKYGCNILRSEVVHRDQWGPIDGAEDDSAPAPSEGSTEATTTEDEAGDRPDAEEEQQRRRFDEIRINSLAAQAEQINIRSPAVMATETRTYTKEENRLADALAERRLQNNREEERAPTPLQPEEQVIDPNTGHHITLDELANQRIAEYGATWQGSASKAKGCPLTSQEEADPPDNTLEECHHNDPQEDHHHPEVEAEVEAGVEAEGPQE